MVGLVIGENLASMADRVQPAVPLAVRVAEDNGHAVRQSRPKGLPASRRPSGLPEWTHELVIVYNLADVFSGRAPKPLVFVTLFTVMLSEVRLAAQAPIQDHPQQYAPADVAAGLRVYNAVCVSCHGPGGAGVGNIDLRRGPLPRAATDAALSALITNGIPGSGMPPTRLDPQELRALVAYLRAGFDANSNAAILPGDAGRGRTFFEGEGNCLNCHRVHDKGEYSGPDLTEIGLTRSAAALQRSLLDPTGSMRPINRPVRAVTKDGTIIIGRRLNKIRTLSSS
jgi:mono/diheme cytochrome c family protein